MPENLGSNINEYEKEMNPVSEQDKAKQRIIKMIKNLDFIVCTLEDIEKVKNSFDIPDDFFLSSEVQEASKQSLTIFLNSPYFNIDFDKANELINILHLPDSIVSEVATEAFIRDASEGRIEQAISLKNNIHVSEEAILNPSVQQAAKEEIINVINHIGLVNNELIKIKKIENSFSVPADFLVSSEVQNIAQKSLANYFTKSYFSIDDAKKLIDIVHLPENVVSEIATEAFIIEASAGKIDQAILLKNNFQISEEGILNPSVQQAAKEKIVQIINHLGLAGYQINDLKKINDLFNIKDIFFNSPEIQDASKNCLISCLQNNFDFSFNLNLAKELINIVHLPDYIVSEIATEAFIREASEGRIDRAISLKNNFPISEEAIVNPSVQQAAKEKMIEAVQYKKFKEIKELREFFNLPDAFYSSIELQDGLKKRIGAILSERRSIEGQIKGIKELLNYFNLSDDFIADVATESFAIQTARDTSDNALAIKKNFKLKGEKQEIGMSIILNCLGFSRLDQIDKLKEEYDISDEVIKRTFIDQINERDFENIVLLDAYFSECQPIFRTFVNEQKEIAMNNELPFPERRKSLDILAGLVKNGEASINHEFFNIISARAKQKEISDSKWGFDSLQESAFYTLMRLDNPGSNQALFDLVFNDNVNQVVKYAVLKKLFRKDNNFFEYQDKESLNDWFYSTSPKRIDWRDLKFINEIKKIPSTELRYKSMDSISILTSLDLNKFPLYKTWNEKYNSIPQNVFMQVMELSIACDNNGLLDKFQKLFTNIYKINSKKENLLYGITNILKTDPQILKLLGQKLENIDFGEKKDADSLSELFRWIIFLDKIERIKFDEYEGDISEYIEDYGRTEELPSENTEVFSKDSENLKDLTSIVKEIASQKFQEILPNKNITAEKIESIEKEWGSLEPIFTYIGRFPNLKGYVAEIVANIDTEADWKKWRYNLEHKGVKNQIGHLSVDQLGAWKEDYFSEIGDIMIAETGSDKPRQIQSILEEAILQHKHIFNPEMGINKDEFIQKVLEETFDKIIKSPDKKEEIIESEVNDLLLDTKNIDAIINFNNISKIRQSIDWLTELKTQTNLSSRIKSASNFLSNYLSDQLKEEFDDNLSKLENEGKYNSNGLITVEVRQDIEAKIIEIENKYKDALASDLWKKHQLDNNPTNLEQIYKKRQEIKATIDLLRLNNLSNKLIATNRIIEKEGKKGGETIIGVIDRLKKYFKGSPLLQDINNIEFLLKEKIDFGEKRRLAMIFTDDSQILWQVGKYPLGNGSCQHYAEGSYASMLMGYVGDSNCKVSYLIDLNKLPVGTRKELQEKGFEEIKNQISKQELLNASIARSIIKLAKDKENDPVILLEPTYTIVYKGDSSMDKYFNLFIDLIVAEPMKAKMARGGGNESVIKGQSLSPEGQYEDLDLNNVKFIHKLSKPTKEEIEIIERIRSSY